MENAEEFLFGIKKNNNVNECELYAMHVCMKTFIIRCDRCFRSLKDKINFMMKTNEETKILDLIQF